MYAANVDEAQMTGVSTSFNKVSENCFSGKRRSQLNETQSIFLRRRGNLPAGIFSRGSTGDILEYTVESGFGIESAIIGN